MNSKIKAIGQWAGGKVAAVDKGRLLYTAFIIPSVIPLSATNAFAAGDTI